MSDKRKYDSTIARMAGNIAGGMWASKPHVTDVADAQACVDEIVRGSVKLARAIVAEVERTEPKV